ncbi:hypothetical protein H4219_001232 [Mycoemilia scoparia]|uniref:BZIP domain-containing protein n=1 Tax=Mycoemilia scoparia TaxID=417184 RepID=A0A9W8DVZ3_9FUNG|nr:hypothetical protein H4219_001232 [Mycoemilia scoparia]
MDNSAYHLVTSFSLPMNTISSSLKTSANSMLAPPAFGFNGMLPESSQILTTGNISDVPAISTINPCTISSSSGATTLDPQALQQQQQSLFYGNQDITGSTVTRHRSDSGYSLSSTNDYKVFRPRSLSSGSEFSLTNGNTSFGHYGNFSQSFSNDENMVKTHSGANNSESNGRGSCSSTSGSQGAGSKRSSSSKDSKQNGSNKRRQSTGSAGPNKGSNGGDEDSDERRRRFLERNRIAASKCRQKKKQWVKELEQRAEEATIQNHNLHTAVAQLKEEILALKSQLIAHRNCNCSMIQQFMQSTLNPQADGVSANPAATSVVMPGHSASVIPNPAILDPQQQHHHQQPPELQQAQITIDPAAVAAAAATTNIQPFVPKAQ